MKLVLLTVGATAGEHLPALIELYAARLRKLVPFELITLPGVPGAGKSAQILREAEGEQILAKLGPGDCPVLFDEHGREFTSPGLAEFVNKQMVAGPKRIVFIIGGAYGFSQSVYNRVPLRCSLSKLTFPHDLVRLIATEQLYRAWSILHHLPYHHP